MRNAFEISHKRHNGPGRKIEIDRFRHGIQIVLDLSFHETQCNIIRTWIKKTLLKS